MDVVLICRVFFVASRLLLPKQNGRPKIHLKGQGDNQTPNFTTDLRQGVCSTEKLQIERLDALNFFHTLCLTQKVLQVSRQSLEDVSMSCFASCVRIISKVDP